MRGLFSGVPPEPGAISLKIARKLLLVHFFLHKFIWEPGAFHHPAGANLVFCSHYFKAWLWCVCNYFLIISTVYNGSCLENCIQCLTCLLFLFFNMFIILIQRKSFCVVSFMLTYKIGGGGTRLPKFKFSAIFPIWFTHDFTNTDKKLQKCLISYVKKYFNRKSFAVQPWTPLEVILNEFCFWITVRCMQRSRKWVLPHWIQLYLPPLYKIVSTCKSKTNSFQELGPESPPKILRQAPGAHLLCLCALCSSYM